MGPRHTTAGIHWKHSTNIFKSCGEYGREAEIQRQFGRRGRGKNTNRGTERGREGREREGTTAGWAGAI